MKTIYVDEMFLLNLVINYFIVLATAKLCALPLKRIRFVLAAALGALYSVLILLPSLRALASPVMKLCLGAAITLVAFGNAKRLLRPFFAFLAVSACFGGAVMGASLLSGGLVSDGFFIGASMKTLVLSFGASYFVITLVFNRLERRRARETLSVSLSLCGKTVSFNALRDTGNELYDPISGLPVMVAGAELAKQLLPDECFAALELGATEFLQALSGYEPLKSRFRLVPYNAVGVSSGLLPVFRPDALSLGGKKRDNLLVGLSSTKMSSNGEFSAVV